MKRNIYSLLIGMGLVLSLPACKDFLNTEPSDAIPTDKVASDISLLPPTLRGLYDELQGSNSSTAYYARGFITAGDVMGDDMQGIPSGSRVQSYYKMSYTKDSAPGIWSKAYRVIRAANRLIDMCTKLGAQSLTDAQKTQVKRAQAQALAIRALAHFDLCRQYATPYKFSNEGTALGVPLLTSVPDNKSLPSRATLKEVYQQIIADFKTAIATPELPETSYGYISKSAAKALLARVYLYMDGTEGNTQALALSKEVIDAGKYTLAKTVEEYKALWSEKNSTEMIFSIANFDSKDWADREGLAYVYHVDGYYNAHVTKKFYDEMLQDPNDIRWNVLTASEGTKAEASAKNTPGLLPSYKVFIGKYPGKAAYKDMRTNDVPVIRLAEVYLNAAEAAFKLGDRATALQYLNVIVKRANPAKSVADADLTLERILSERSKELVGEGHRFFDLMRNGLRCERFYGGQVGWHGPLEKESQAFDHTYFRTLLPIPIDEINLGSDLAKQQNPGY
jgi:tetratricopeptide repeat protein